VRRAVSEVAISIEPSPKGRPDQTNAASAPGESTGSGAGPTSNTTAVPRLVACSAPGVTSRTSSSPPFDTSSSIRNAPSSASIAQDAESGRRGTGRRRARRSGRTLSGPERSPQPTSRSYALKS
jgi:hypothetical protein